MTAALVPTFAGLSDIGRIRATNQDRWGADPEQSLFMVADGVACSTDGALAAALVVELLPTYVRRHLKPDDGDDAADLLGRALVEYCDDFRAYAASDDRAAGANTTVVAVVVAGERALVAHLGDSRAYLLREQQLQQITRDHSVIQDMIDAGEVSVEEAERHPARAILTRHVAMFPRPLPDAAAVDLQAGDRILLSSDGLHGVVDDSALAQILDSHPEPADACEALIEAALKAGGPDNVTAVVVNIADGSGQEPADG
ncbi:PP2C family serine/threonine-protein phosphatase [Mycobacterium sp. TY814]|uniref:PP2C family protein-serine/threonine phosphatase n=1 Tax=unclassified Mycobacterium TaxID=2642494 RepID=UPI00274195A6|nr:protein phosphatase 2C domain-containing protein [Mycobacterium sp. TY814]MDP7723252.1 protein phosphatase 2C domain-containing protein [Mycobacterium sp. TY814]